MVSFHPLVLLAIPVAGLGLLVGIGLSVGYKSWLLLILSLAAPVLIAGPLFNGSRIRDAGWRKSLTRHHVANKKAIDSADFSLFAYDEIPYKDSSPMVPLPGFAWATPQSAAANGISSGFEVESIRHIYVKLIRNGCEGVAWIEDEALIPKLDDSRYWHSGVEHWYFWRLYHQ